jgi:hypothetical protein
MLRDDSTLRAQGSRRTSKMARWQHVSAEARTLWLWSLRFDIGSGAA